MDIESANYSKELQNLQNKMESQYSGFKSEKLINDEKAVQGVREVVHKLNNTIKKMDK